MPISEKDFVQQFSKQVLDGRTALFLGAGGSADAGYPTWRALFKPMVDELGLDQDEMLDNYALAQFYSNRYGALELRRRIEAALSREPQESQLINRLVNIGFESIWTTNFDNAIETAFKKKNVLVNTVISDRDLGTVDTAKRINIFKMNGSISNLSEIIATQNDYEMYSRSHELMMLFFKRELISSTFLFIGYSFTDGLVLECLSSIAHCLGDSFGMHYSIMRRVENSPYFEYFIRDLEERYHLRVLLVDGYDDIPRVLDRLSAAVKSKKVFISGALGYEASGDQKRLSLSFSKSIVAALYGRDYRITNGIGRYFGTHLIGYASEHLARAGIKNPERYLSVTAFTGIGEHREEQKAEGRIKAIDGCGACLFVFGSHIDGDNMGGVWEEYKIARDLGKVIVPIRCAGMTSQSIWEDVRAHLTQFPYLEKSLDVLDIGRDSEQLALTIISILDDAGCFA